MTLRPKDGVVRFVDAGIEVTLTFDELALEAAQARAKRQAAGRAQPRRALRFEFPSPQSGGPR